jgi:hypothetical protein
MKHVSTAALALALALGGAAATPALAKEKAPAAAAAPKPTEAVIKANAIVAPAVKAADWAKVKETALPLASTVTNNDDKLFVGQWLIQAGQATQDEDTLSKGIDLMMASGRAPADMVKQLTFIQGQLAFKKKDYPKAITAMQAAIAAGSTDPNAYPILVESMRANGQKDQALALLTEAAKKNVAAGQPVPTEWYQRGFSIAYAAKPNEPGYAATRQAGIDLSKMWATSEPKGSVWHDTVLLYRESVTEDADLKLDINRFLLASKGLISAGDYLEYAEAVYLRYPGEAKAALDAGVASGKVVLASNRNAQEINGIVTAKIPADKGSLAASEKSAGSAATFKAALATGDAYYGYGDYAKAIALYNVAAGKGADANLINLRIGEAQFRAGDMAAAKASFAKVTGTRKNLADFWVILADHPVTA